MEARRATAAFALLCSATAAVAEAEVRLELVGGGDEASFAVVGLAPALFEATSLGSLSTREWQSFFSVHVDRVESPALLGDYSADSTGLHLRPAFPPQPGVRYQLVFEPGVLADLVGHPQEVDRRLTRELLIPFDAPQSTTVVEMVYPSTDLLPENLLKMYLHFSAPMSQGDSYRYISILDSRGDVEELSFLELEQELWDPRGQRLTLLFDPGRLKRGLRPHRDIGPALESGFDFALRIDPSWPDARGAPLVAEYQKRFRARPPDRKSPDPKRWRVEPPSGHSFEALTVHLDEPLDHALLHRHLTLEDAGGKIVDGRIEVGEEERSWRFFAKKAWTPGRYQLRVNPRLEDLAGNRVSRLFEVDLTEVPTTAPSAAELSIEVVIVAP